MDDKKEIKKSKTVKKYEKYDYNYWCKYIMWL